MPKHYVYKRTMCPYYKHENPSVIYCDGVVDDSVTHLAFASRSVAMGYKTAFCRDRYEKCHIYRMLEGINEETI